MRTHALRLAVGFTAALTIGAFNAPASAQQDTKNWPTKNIRLMSGFPVGGVVDTANRIIGKKMREELGVEIIPLPTPGAGGALASQKLAHSPADGYLLLTQTTGAMFIRPLLLGVPYSYQDFTPVGTMAISVTTVSVRKDAPWKTLADFIKDAKAHPKKYSYADTGIGGLQHLAMEMLAKKTGIDVVEVAYKGGPQTIAAVLGGQTDLVVGDNVNSGIRALATTNLNRSPRMPDVPTLKELGYDIELSVRMSIIGPKGLPPSVVSKLEAALERTVKDPEAKKALEKLGLDVVFTPSAQLAQIWAKRDKTINDAVAQLGLAKKFKKNR